MSNSLIALLARRDFTYDGQFRRRGECFYSSPLDALQLMNGRDARLATVSEISAARVAAFKADVSPEPPPPDPEPPKRTYKRRTPKPDDEEGSPGPTRRQYRRRDLEPEP